MTITHEQKADIGTRYVEAMKKRIAVRTVAQARAIAQAKGIDTDEDGDQSPTRQALIQVAGAKLAKRHRIDATAIEADSYYKDHKTTPCVAMIGTNGERFLVPMSTIKEIAVFDARCEKAKELSRELCQEIEFLHGQLSPTRIACFQANAGRLWAPRSKDEVIGAPRLAALIDDFLAGARPAVCKVA